MSRQLTIVHCTVSRNTHSNPRSAGSVFLLLPLLSLDFGSYSDGCFWNFCNSNLRFSSRSKYQTTAIPFMLSYAPRSISFAINCERHSNPKASKMRPHKKNIIRITQQTTTTQVEDKEETNNAQLLYTPVMCP